MTGPEPAVEAAVATCPRVVDRTTGGPGELVWIRLAGHPARSSREAVQRKTRLRSKSRSAGALATTFDPISPAPYHP